MPTRDIEIINKLGLHARASAKLTQTASAFPCEVTLATVAASTPKASWA
jgi:phosphocarrier protein